MFELLLNMLPDQLVSAKKCPSQRSDATMRCFAGLGALGRRFAVTHPTHPGPVSHPHARTFPTLLVQLHLVSANIRVRVGLGPGGSSLLLVVSGN